jgi:hypothetical protein
MAGSWWRLLVAFLLILAAALLRAQDPALEGRALDTPGSELPVRYQPFGASGLPPSSTSNSPRSGSLPGNSLDRFPVRGDPVRPYPFTSGPIGLPQLVQMAGIIFSGSVASITRATTPNEHAATAVTFKVQQAIRGTSAGRTVTIREWAGLWSRGERYRVGEHVFLFLYSPSRLGLTSPVAGGMGRFAVDSKGTILLNPQHVQLLANDPILGGKSVARFADFAAALQHSVKALQ